MTVYGAPDTHSYQRTFRVFSWSAIAALLGIFLFSVFEPQGVSRSTNVALAFLMGAIVLAAVVYAVILSLKEGMWKVKQAFQWELTDDKIIQSHKDGRTVEIPLNAVKSLHEYHGWLLIGGGEPPKGITVPSDLNGYQKIKRELTSHCSLCCDPFESESLSLLVPPFHRVHVVVPAVPHLSCSCGHFDIWSCVSPAFSGTGCLFAQTRLADQIDSQSSALILFLGLANNCLAFLSARESRQLT